MNTAENPIFPIFPVLPSSSGRSKEGLAVEDDEKRALREKVETFKAQDLDQLESDLKAFSDSFNKRLQALVHETETSSLSSESVDYQSTYMNHNSPFGNKVRRQRFS
ncbi:hypothetical protein C7999DRAFT_14471 [Corynascus novoguineensis]|uniref:Uncharacterized protein n=1 Tax=Corynascus novoguineensis TaxID=1126955 RepID=A0AAN7HP03_9PEZI|nr:hypothetical protein C7999DRAFT_14471 [Corynascus novoguineensis]